MVRSPIANRDIVAQLQCLPFEAQDAAWLDIYLIKNIVFNIEAGHSIFRRVRLGIENAKPKYYYKDNLNDGMLLKASLAYRLRFHP